MSAGAVHGRVDLHTHVLPGLDDGAQDDAMALRMLRMAADDGTGAVVATPHSAFCDAESVASAVERLRGLAEEAGIPLELLGGSEQRLVADLPERLRAGQVATIAGTSWVLVELTMEHSWPAWFDRAVYELQMAGGWPILAHAERYPAVQRNPWILSGAAAAGVLVQINGGSLFGGSGRSARQAAEQLLRTGLAHLIASDAHSPEHRPPLLADAFARAAELCGPEAAAEIERNARRVVAGESVTPSLPWPDEAEEPTGIRRLFGRLRRGAG